MKFKISYMGKVDEFAIPFLKQMTEYQNIGALYVEKYINLIKGGRWEENV